MPKKEASIFKTYYSEKEFKDQYFINRSEAVDVIIPLMHTNELWRSNLLSFYREIPINRLLIGDGGCIDDSIEIAKTFPRVKILDHKDYKSLGFSIRKLIEAVETDWFIYLHSDVYLPEGWFEKMRGHKSEFDWFGCPMQHTVLVEYPGINKTRPYAGSQMGRKKAFQNGLNDIEDDFVYRQEDFVFSDIVKKTGFREGRVEDTFHYHQTMYKPSRWGRKISNVDIKMDINRDEEIRTYETQVKGFIKYLEPSNIYSDWITEDLIRLKELGRFNWKELKSWIKQTNPVWLKYIQRWRINRPFLLKRFKRFIASRFI